MPVSQEASCSTKPRANAAFRSAAAPAAVAGTSRPRMRGQGCPRDSRRDAGATNCRLRQECVIGLGQPSAIDDQRRACNPVRHRTHEKQDRIRNIVRSPDAG